MARRKPRQSVMFRVWEGRNEQHFLMTHEVFALFPSSNSHSDHGRDSYSSYAWYPVIGDRGKFWGSDNTWYYSRPAVPSEYGPLRRRLYQMGLRLKVLPPTHRGVSSILSRARLYKHFIEWFNQPGSRKKGRLQWLGR